MSPLCSASRVNGNHYLTNKPILLEDVKRVPNTLAPLVASRKLEYVLSRSGVHFDSRSPLPTPGLESWCVRDSQFGRIQTPRKTGFYALTHTLKFQSASGKSKQNYCPASRGC